MKYELCGNDIYTERGKVAATLDENGNAVMAPGMAGAHTAGVRAFLESLKFSGTDEEEVNSEKLSGGDDFREADVSTIPDEDLPEMTAELGVNTPGFHEFCELNNLTPEQVDKLVRRITNNRI